jgi:hypothetical protein
VTSAGHIKFAEELENETEHERFPRSARRKKHHRPSRRRIRRHHHFYSYTVYGRITFPLSALG